MKRQKLEDAWGAEVFDHFGMTEAAFVAGEGLGHEGLHIWADQFYVEVLDEKTGDPLPDGEVGSLVVTPLWNNTMTPFLRWSSGDLVSVEKNKSRERHPWSVFPLLKRAPHGRLLQGARRQHQPRRPRGRALPRPGRGRLPRRGGERRR